jgi:hypothetical protein
MDVKVPYHQGDHQRIIVGVENPFFIFEENVTARALAGEPSRAVQERVLLRRAISWRKPVS